MAHYKGVLAIIVDAAKKKGVRFNINDFSHDDVKRLDQYVVILTGDAAKFADSLFKG